MPALGVRIWPLRWIGRHARTEVLALSLKGCGAAGEESRGIAAELLGIARTYPDGLAVPALVSRWTHLSPAQQDELTMLVGLDWPALAAYMSKDPDAATRVSIVRACAAVGGLGVLAGPSLVGLLADESSEVAESAEAALGSFMQQLTDRRLDAQGQSAARACAEGTIETFDTHRRSGALRIAIQHGLVGAGGGSMRWMSQPDHPAHMVVRGLIRTNPDPSMRSCAWVWLKHAALAPACAQRLTRADSLAEQSLVLERAHLGLNPRRALALRSNNRVGEREFGAALPRFTQIDGLSEEARAGLPRWLETLPLTHRVRDAASAVLLTDTSPAVRMSLAMRAAETDHPPACLQDLVFDEEAGVATLAADGLLARGSTEQLETGQGAGTLGLLARSVHEPLRSLAAQVNQRGQQAGVDVAHAVRVAQRFAEAGGESVSPRSAASAIVRLSGVENQDAQIDDLLLRAAEVSDARVRANAIEGLLRRSRRSGGPLPARVASLLESKSSDAHHRIRANAARGMLLSAWGGQESQGDRLLHLGGQTLASLLTDGRTMHRVAGLWLAHRLGDTLAQSGQLDAQTGLLERVIHAGGRAVDPMERAWSERARVRLEASIRGRWAKQAPALQESAA